MLVSGKTWSGSRDTIWSSRIFEHTHAALTAKFRQNNNPDFVALARFPALFVQESTWDHTEVARVGQILRAQFIGCDIHIDYKLDPNIAPITNQHLESIAVDLGIENVEFARTHWAVKDVDLYYVLLTHQGAKRKQPSVFSINDPQVVEPDLLSVMMPFDAGFDPVYMAIREAADRLNMRCQRADDIWQHPEVIQDIVTLIDGSRIVIADCSHRNTNVFYEIGIAHALGKEVILIAQSKDDIPFDLRHLRFLAYHNNGEGRQKLQDKLVDRIKSFQSG